MSVTVTLAGALGPRELDGGATCCSNAVGEGSFGEVYHARDTRLYYPVALKLLRPDLTRRLAPTELLDEGRVLGRCVTPT